MIALAPGHISDGLRYIGAFPLKEIAAEEPHLLWTGPERAANSPERDKVDAFAAHVLQPGESWYPIYLKYAVTDGSKVTVTEGLRVTYTVDGHTFQETLNQRFVIERITGSISES